MILLFSLRMTNENELSKTALEGQNLDNTSLVIPVIEEELIVGKKVVESGRVVISKQVEETSETVNIELLHDEHAVEHVPVNEFVDAVPAVRYEGDTIIIPVMKEVLVKRILLVEEIRITKKSVQSSERQEVTLRKEKVHVERVVNNNQ